MAFVPITEFVPHFHKPDGSLALGCTLAAFIANTTTPTPFYLNEGGDEAGTSLTLNDRGEPEVSGNIVILWRDTEVDYKYVLTDPDTGQQWSVDDVISPVRQATESTPGIVQLYDDIDSTSSTFAATANALRIVAEMAQQAITIAQAGLPVGAEIMWPTSSPPDETWQECNGGSLLVSEFPEYFALVGYMHGGSGANFNKPDWRGKFPRGWAHGSTRDPDRAARTDRGDGTTGDEVGTNQSFAMQNITGSFFTPGGGGSYTGVFSDGGATGTGRDSASSGRNVNLNASSQVQTSTETRPINMNRMMIVKVKSALD